MTGPAKPTTTGSTPIATGGMSREGTTTVVKISRPRLDLADQKVLCSAICKCKGMPGLGKDGRSLKQVCVSSRLTALDEALQHRSTYKPEVTYDMTKRPPAPILDKEVETKARDLWPGWTRTLWPKDPQRPVPYVPGSGYTRRPDVVIVSDPNKPPTQDNIKQVVEIKFAGDTYSEGQEESYIRIAGDEMKFVALGPENCNCGNTESTSTKIPVEQLGTAAAGAALLYFLLTKRPPPTPVPAF